MFATPLFAQSDVIKIGSKDDIETGILGEVLAALARQAGAEVEANVIDAGSGTVFNAIVSGEIDAYIEYTGTLTGSTLSQLELTSLAQLEAALADRGLSMTDELGFNNTYALAVTRELADELGLVTTSDLADHPDLRVAVSSEWFGRADGWPQLKAAYGLPQDDVTALGEHRLLYRAITSGQTDVIEVYTTEAAIEANDLVVLEDDQSFFPQYMAFVLYRTELEQSHPTVVEAWRQMAGTLDEASMTALNARVEGGLNSESAAAAAYLAEHFTDAADDVTADLSLPARLWQRTVEHAWLVVAAMVLGIALAVPLGVLAAGGRTAGRVVLGITGIVQTIPSIALLVFMIPLLG
ncbi:MAG: glycine betaine ABC transporter substrate-binding protein, partial [Planctomycetota bacterium]